MVAAGQTLDRSGWLSLRSGGRRQLAVAVSRLMGAGSSDIRKRFGTAVRARRAELGLTQEELAEAARINRSYIGDIERGARNVSLRNVEKLLLALRISWAQFFRRYLEGGRWAVEGTVRQRAAGRTDLIDIAALGIRFPWLYEREQDCIVSPDADGLLCGLLMSHHLGWRIRGFYDAKVLVCSSAVRPQNCVFLDMEIFRPNVRSVGQHLLMYNRNRIPPNWDHFESAFAINEVRGIDARTFDQKYPFGTIHFLMVALHSRLRLEVPDGAIAP
jgi:transcriptional regulator with XRE-family HTH domain